MKCPGEPEIMKIIGLKSYGNGYTGFLEEEDAYVYFIYYRHGKLKKLMKYNKADFTNYAHFVGIMTKFAPASFFLKEPIHLTSLSTTELDNLSSKSTRSLNKTSI